ncbi:MAG: Translation initiation factor 1, partial [uncultured Acidimicrobiales bacterium]
AGRHRCRTPSQRDVQGGARERPPRARPQLGPHAHEPHPHPDGRSRPGGDHPLRPHPRSDHLSVQV